jgi:multiple sugar transport system ATP-binding protein
MAHVSVKDLEVKFGSVVVLQHLNIAVEKGEFLVLLGPSGCGKSTLLNSIAGLLDISQGQIFIAGDNVTWKEPSQRHIGMVFQSYALYPRMTVERNMSFGMRTRGAPAAEIQKRVNAAADLLHLQELLHRRPSELSGGQRQRVAIGRALCRDAEVYLFDEPLSNLDAKLRTELRVELKKLHIRLGSTMIYVTHDQVEAMTLADRIAIMNAGIIQQLAPPSEVYHKPNSLYVAGFIGSPGMNMIEGEVVKNGSGAAFKCAAGTVPLARYGFAGPAKEGAAILGIRPEHIVVGASGADKQAGSGSVTILEPMGAETVIWSRFGETPITIRVEGDSPLGIGDNINYAFDVAKASLFDKASGNRM